MSMPPGVPPDPNAPSTTTPSTDPPAPAYPAPTQYTPAASPAPAAGTGDPLVLPAGSPFGAWFNKFMEVAKRSWKSALIITGGGIAVPLAVVTLVSYAMGAGGMFSVFDLFGFGYGFGTFLLAFFVKIVLCIAAAFVASAAWAGGTWALVKEAQTGQSANIGGAFSYGLKRAAALFPWAVVVGFAFVIGTSILYLPGLYVAFAASMFGFVAIFERGQQPIMRSVNLTHKSSSIGPTIGKVGITFAIFLVWNGIIGAIFGAIALAIAIGSLRSGLVYGYGYHFGLGYGIIEGIGTLLLAPAFAVLLIGLLVTYGELRAQEAPTTTADLDQQLG